MKPEHLAPETRGPGLRIYQTPFNVPQSPFEAIVSLASHIIRLLRRKLRESRDTHSHDQKNAGAYQARRSEHSTDFSPVFGSKPGRVSQAAPQIFQCRLKPCVSCGPV